MSKPLTIKDLNEQNSKVKCWDELHELHLACAGMLASISPLASVLRDKKAIAQCSDTKALVEEAKILSNDMLTYSNKLQEIQSKHKERHGGDDNPDNLMACLQIAEQYYAWIDSFQTVVTPTYDSLSHNLRGETLAEFTEVDEQEQDESK